jgi:hypothetical protein
MGVGRIEPPGPRYRNAPEPHVSPKAVLNLFRRHSGSLLGMVGHSKQADGVGQQVLTRFDRDVSDIGERARDKIGAAAPRNLQPIGV